MPPASNEEQFKFLISCIRYSNNGKVDFSQVAQECKIVSKGAAAKRYERMMRAHGIAPNAATIKPAPSRCIKIDRRNSTDKPASKKRKAEAYVEDNGATDDDETFSNTFKSDPAADKEKLMIKEEEHGQDIGQQLSMNEAANLMQYYDNSSPYNGGLAGDQDYAGCEYSGSVGSYATPIGGYGLQAQQPYDFGASYGNVDMSGIPRTVDQGLGYQSMMQFPVDPQGRSDSPVIVE